MTPLPEKKVAILQSNFIPWIGYFDLISKVDEFVIFDDMQFTRRDWRNRNRIQTPQGSTWLTIAVQSKGNYHQAIKDTKVANPDWGDKIWKTISLNYKKAPFFNEFSELFEKLFLQKQEFLSQINFSFLTAMCEIFEITTPLTWSHDYGCIESKTERLLDLCQKAKGTEYVSGPAAKGYIEPEVFSKNDVELYWIRYGPYPEYSQCFSPFIAQMSALDLIFNIGPKAKEMFQHSALVKDGEDENH